MYPQSFCSPTITTHWRKNVNNCLLRFNVVVNILSIRNPTKYYSITPHDCITRYISLERPHNMKNMYCQTKRSELRALNRANMEPIWSRVKADLCIIITHTKVGFDDDNQVESYFQYVRYSAIFFCLRSLPSMPRRSLYIRAFLDPEFLGDVFCFDGSCKCMSFGDFALSKKNDASVFKRIFTLFFLWQLGWLRS